MQTTLRINDEVYRRAKAKSGELGLSITRFFEEAIQERLEKLEKRNSGKISLLVSSISGSPMSEKMFQERLRTADLEEDFSKLEQ